jgi:hypothetical protein
MGVKTYRAPPRSPFGIRRAAIWAHPTNRAHQRRWIEAVNILRTNTTRGWVADQKVERI